MSAVDVAFNAAGALVSLAAAWVCWGVARERQRDAAAAFWRGVCAERARVLDEDAERLHAAALRACWGRPAPRRGTREIGATQEEIAWAKQCEARALRAEASR